MQFIITDAWLAKSRTVHLSGTKLVLAAVRQPGVAILGHPRGRMYGSTEKYVLRTRSWPSRGSGIGISAISNRSSSGNPFGRATSLISRETPSIRE